MYNNAKSIKNNEHHIYSAHLLNTTTVQLPPAQVVYFWLSLKKLLVLILSAAHTQLQSQHYQHKTWTWTGPSSQPSLMGEVRLACDTSWHRNKNDCITAPKCLGLGWLLLLTPCSQSQEPTKQQAPNLAIPDLLSESAHWQIIMGPHHSLLPPIAPDLR